MFRSYIIHNISNRYGMTDWAEYYITLEHEYGRHPITYVISPLTN